MNRAGKLSKIIDGLVKDPKSKLLFEYINRKLVISFALLHKNQVVTIEELDKIFKVKKENNK